MRGIYACLSYCWGNSETQSGQTTRDKLSKHLEGIPFQDLPGTVADAVRLCRKLGFRFLWIDRLCIIQDDHGDWANEASRMCEVYSRSALTISVPICKESSQGFVAERRKGFREQGEFTTVTYSDGESKLQCGSWFCDTHPLRHHGPWFLEYDWKRLTECANHKDNRWMSRGWTFQEWMLSPRVLHIDSMTMWDCFGGYANEINRRHMGKANIIRDPTELGRGLPWEFIVQEYSRREVSREGDRLPALAGLADRYAQATGHTYLAGLWREGLPLSLIWVGGGPLSQCAPSWSWASRNERVSFVDGPAFFTKRVSVSAVFCEYNPPGSFMAVDKAWIDIDGRVSAITEQYTDDFDIKVKAGDEWWVTRADEGRFQGDAIAQASLYLLVLGSSGMSHLALVLQECGWEDGRQCFQRAGMAWLDFQLDSPLPEHGPSWEPRAVRLV